jgi:hypothetical protein
LTFGKYKLEDHLQLEHNDCGSIGHHCIRHGLRSCEEVKDHEGQCSDCLKFFECGKNLKRFLNTQYNDICRAFENHLSKWSRHGSTLLTEPLPDDLTNPDTARNEWRKFRLCDERRWCALPAGKSGHDFACGDGRDPHKADWCKQNQESWMAGRQSLNSVMTIENAERKCEIKCIKCGNRRFLPEGIDVDDLPPDWHCGLRTWCMRPTENGYGQFSDCNKGRVESRLIKQHARALEARRAHALTTIVSPVPTTQGNVDFDNDSTPIVVEEEHSQPVYKKQKTHGTEIGTHANANANVEAAIDEAGTEGKMRSRMRDLSELIYNIAYVPAWYAAHVALGKWQAREIERMKIALAAKDNEGQVAMFTIDMKSKTKTGENLEA